MKRASGGATWGWGSAIPQAVDPPHRDIPEGMQPLHLLQAQGELRAAGPLDCLLFMSLLKATARALGSSLETSCSENKNH